MSRPDHSLDPTSAQAEARTVADQRQPPPSAPPQCPFCGSRENEPLSPFASQLSTSQYVCLACHSPFEFFTRGA
jgi:hypothetical protein